MVEQSCLVWIGLFYPYLKSVYIHFVEYVFLEFYTYFKMFEYVYLSIVNKVINYINRPFWLFGDRELDHLESWINLIQRRICKRIKKPFWVMIQWVRVRVNSPNQEEDETQVTWFKSVQPSQFSMDDFNLMDMVKKLADRRSTIVALAALAIKISRSLFHSIRTFEQIINSTITETCKKSNLNSSFVE